MKILILADINSSHTRKWVNGIRQQNIDVAVFSMSFPRDDWYSVLGVDCCYFGADPELQSKQSALAKLSYVKAIRKLKKFYKSVKPDIVHAHYATSYGLMGALLKKKPFIVSVWGSDIQDFPYRSRVHKLLLKFVFSRSSVVCSTSKSMLKDIDFVGDFNKLQIPFGINVEEFQLKEHKVKPEINFGTLKTLETVYGIDILLRAFQLYLQVTKSSDKLIIYGKGAQEDEYKQLAKDLTIEDRVNFKGYAKRESVAEAFLDLDVYMSLSRRESYGVAALEASACGLPVITGKAEGFDEVVEHGFSGYREDINDLNAIVERMREMQSVEMRRAMGNYGRKMVEKDFVFKDNLKTQIDLYKKLLHEGKFKK